MKKYLTVVVLGLFLYFTYNYIVYYQGDLFIPYKDEIQTFTKSQGESLMIDEGAGFEVFDIKGVNLGLGKPGKFASEFAITKEEYLRWFKQIHELGANCIRTYTIAHADFYEAFYEFNQDNPSPLYLIHGVDVDDYLINSHRDAFDEEFYEEFLDNCKDTVDVIHGRFKSFSSAKTGSQTYKTDISPWVYGYIIGVEWDGDIVAFTNNTGPQLEQFHGDYLYTEDANNFEIFLADMGDKMISYESKKYGDQRTIAFSNWSETDPFTYPENVSLQFRKITNIDVENIKSKESFQSGQYASYHAYPYYPEYSHFLNKNVENTYLDYLTRLNKHHSMPVVISEFGLPSSRAMESYEQNTDLGRNQGALSEKDQGEALVSLYDDIKASGSAGGIMFLWQDEWFKRTTNTIPFVDLEQNVHWSDAQTNTQAFGLLTFDPGEKMSICYVDGDKSEWDETHLVSARENHKLSMKYDEKYIYFLVEKEGLNPMEEKIYIPIDLTEKSGSEFIKPLGLKTDRPTDFVIEINGENESRVWVQDRYDKTQAIYGNQIVRSNNQYENAPEKDSTKFNPIKMVLNEYDYYYDGKSLTFGDYDFGSKGSKFYFLFQTYETGKLVHGNANPAAKDFNSLADFSFGEDLVEIKIPWLMLNFSDPSDMKIHDDYYERYGVEFMKINKMYVGVGDGSSNLTMDPFNLKKLGKSPKYHERLKDSYDILQDYWMNN